MQSRPRRYRGTESQPERHAICADNPGQKGAHRPAASRPGAIVPRRRCPSASTAGTSRPGARQWSRPKTQPEGDRQVDRRDADGAGRAGPSDPASRPTTRRCASPLSVDPNTVRAARHRAHVPAARNCMRHAPRSQPATPPDVHQITRDSILKHAHDKNRSS